jgi:hypothetical protein
VLRQFGDDFIRENVINRRRTCRLPNRGPNRLSPNFGDGGGRSGGGGYWLTVGRLGDDPDPSSAARGVFGQTSPAAVITSRSGR